MMYNAKQFTDGLRAFGDPLYPKFGSWPASVLEAANQWADLIDSATTNIFPVVLPSARINAKNTLAAQLDMAFSAGAGVHSIPMALQIYAASLAIGMQPLFTATPPAIPINLLPIIAMQHRNPTAEESMSVMGLLVTTWLKTGTAINNSNGVVVNWL